MSILSMIYDICLSNKNIIIIIAGIEENAKLNDKFKIYCSSLAKKLIKYQIAKSAKISNLPQNNKQLREYIKQLNKLCVMKISNALIKKYPSCKINKRVQVNHEKLQRDYAIYGDRDNKYLERPYAEPKKDYTETLESFQAHDIGYKSLESNQYSNIYQNNGDYLLVSSIPEELYQANDDKDKTMKKYEQIINERNYNNKEPRTLPAPDFSDKFYKDTRTNSQYDQIPKNNYIDGLDAFSSFSDNPYASLLGDGAPPPNLDTSFNTNLDAKDYERMVAERMEQYKSNHVIPSTDNQSTVSDDSHTIKPLDVQNNNDTDNQIKILQLALQNPQLLDPQLLLQLSQLTLSQPNINL